MYDFELNNAEKDLVAQGRLIDAIRAYRNRTGQGLRESKEAIDAYRYKTSTRQAPPSFSMPGTGIEVRLTVENMRHVVNAYLDGHALNLQAAVDQEVERYIASGEFDTSLRRAVRDAIDEAARSAVARAVRQGDVMKVLGDLLAKNEDQ